MKAALALPAVAFLAGLGISHLLPAAQAQSCSDTYDRWDLAFVSLERVAGEGSETDEEEYWRLGGILESSTDGGIRYYSDTVALTAAP